MSNQLDINGITLKEFLDNSLDYIQTMINNKTNGLCLDMNIISSKIIFEIKNVGGFDIDLRNIYKRFNGCEDILDFTEMELDSLIEIVCCKYSFYRNESEKGNLSPREKEIRIKNYEEIKRYLNEEIVLKYKELIIKNINELDFYGNISRYDLYWKYVRLYDKSEEKNREKKYRKLRKEIVYLLKNYYEDLMNKKINVYWLDRNMPYKYDINNEIGDRLIIKLEGLDGEW